MVGNLAENFGREMIITPKVRDYVQNYFRCNDNFVGGMLEDEGIYFSVSRWVRFSGKSLGKKNLS